MKVLIVIGTRPNFIKVTQFKKLVKQYNTIDLKIVHTGQHYDDKMADVFFKQFDLTPDYFLNIIPGSPNSQIAEIMVKLEKLINTEFSPDLLMVVGDVNSTLAAALTANKMGIKLAHIESGLRSYDNSMPEEHNRILTDNLTDLFFVTEQSGYDNLIQNNISETRIFFCGNTMIDTLVAYSEQINSSPIFDELNIESEQFVLMTMHRPATVDEKQGLLKLSDLISYITQKYKLVFPIHPRTLKKLEEFGLKDKFTGNPNLILTQTFGLLCFSKIN
jgi:UDP-N-acetylglucosamine 2-epimerase (non-hydrolysing)